MFEKQPDGWIEYKFEHKGQITESDPLKQPHDKFIERCPEVSTEGSLKKEHLHRAEDLKKRIRITIESFEQVNIDGFISDEKLK